MNTDNKTLYPGIGADEGIAELQRLVGEITSFWAQVEDGLFEVFVVAVMGAWLIKDIRPIRAVFFSFGSYESKMRMVDNAMKTRYENMKLILEEWTTLKKSMNSAAKLRNEVAHLVPLALYTPDSTAKANVRLAPPFWKGMTPHENFDQVGYSASQLSHEMAAYWGIRPPFHLARTDVPTETLGYRLKMFSQKLIIPPNPVRPQ